MLSPFVFILSLYTTQQPSDSLEPNLMSSSCEIMQSTQLLPSHFKVFPHRRYLLRNPFEMSFIVLTPPVFLPWSGQWSVTNTLSFHSRLMCSMCSMSINGNSSENRCMRLHFKSEVLILCLLVAALKTSCRPGVALPLQQSTCMAASASVFGGQVGNDKE